MTIKQFVRTLEPYGWAIIGSIWIGAYFRTSDIGYIFAALTAAWVSGFYFQKRRGER